MDMESLLWDIGGGVMGVLAALGTLYLLRITENIFSRARKSNADSKKDEKE